MPFRAKVRDLALGRSRKDRSTTPNAVVASPSGTRLNIPRSTRTIRFSSYLRFLFYSPASTNIFYVSSSPVNPAFEAALQQHINKLDASERSAFNTSYHDITPEDLLSRVREYDDEHSQEATFRRCAEPVAKILRVIEQFMQGVAIGIQSSPEISSLVVGAVRVIIDVCFSIDGGNRQLTLIFTDRCQICHIF